MFPRVRRVPRDEPGDAAPDELAALPELWAARRCLVVFARHVGCMLCWQLLAGIASVQHGLRENNVRVGLLAPRLF
jgi:hypothetical protein